MISGDGISKWSQSDGPSICANHRSIPETVSSIEISHGPDEPFAKSPRFSLGISELARIVPEPAMNRLLLGNSPCTSNIIKICKFGHYYEILSPLKSTLKYSEPPSSWTSQ